MVKYLPLKSLDLDERSEGSGSRSFAPHPELHHAPDVAVGGRPVAVAGAGHHGVAPGAEVDVDVALVDALALVLVGVLGDHRGLAVVDALVLADELEALAPAHRPLPSVGGAGQVPVGRLRGVDRERPWRLGVAEHGGVELAALLLDLPAARVGDGVAAIGAAELLEPGRHGPAWLRAAAGGRARCLAGGRLARRRGGAGGRAATVALASQRRRQHADQRDGDERQDEQGQQEGAAGMGAPDDRCRGGQRRPAGGGRPVGLPVCRRPLGRLTGRLHHRRRV